MVGLVGQEEQQNEGADLFPCLSSGPYSGQMQRGRAVVPSPCLVNDEREGRDTCHSLWDLKTSVKATFTFPTRRGGSEGPRSVGRLTPSGLITATQSTVGSDMSVDSC